VKRTNHRISVIIPAFCQGNYLVELVEALLGQTLCPEEIIVCHSSTHNPVDLLSSYKPLVRVLHHDEPLFAGAARNIGAAHATGDWLLFIDEDVIPRSDCLEKILKATERHPDCAVFAGSVGYATTGGYWGLCLWYMEFGNQHPYLHEDLVPIRAGCINMISAEAFHTVQGYPDLEPAGEDLIIQLKIKDQYDDLAFIPSAIACHHNVPGFSYFLTHLKPLGVAAARVRYEYELGVNFLYRYPLLCLFLPFARVALLVKNGFSRNNKKRWILPVLLPGIFLGFCIWSYNFYTEAVNLESK
jgi:glycosyltransferase involved in cell wall biosynthesis